MTAVTLHDGNNTVGTKTVASSYDFPLSKVFRYYYIWFTLYNTSEGSNHRIGTNGFEVKTENEWITVCSRVVKTVSFAHCTFIFLFFRSIAKTFTKMRFARAATTIIFPSSTNNTIIFLIKFLKNSEHTKKGSLV